MKIKILLCLCFSIFALNARVYAKCPVDVAIVNLPVFLESGEKNWVHSFLVAQDENGHPNLDNVLDENYFFAQAPVLKENEDSRKISLGFLHSHCGRVNKTFEIEILVTKTNEKFLPNFGAKAKTTLVQEKGEFVPRLQLHQSTRLFLEYQFLPQDGPIAQNTIQGLFDLNNLWSDSFWLRVVVPVESQVLAVMESEETGVFTKAEELGMGSEIRERSLITNVSDSELTVYQYAFWAFFWQILKPGQALKVETGFVFFDKPTLVSKIRSLSIY